MRKFKTAEDNRTNYIYYFNDGTSYTITPGENGENATIISQLHGMDDEELDAQRREAYHCPVHLDGYHDGDGDDDEGITGTKKDVRAGLLSMIADCEDGKIEFIITKSISRFARNTTDCLEMVRKLTDLGISIFFEKENINTGSMESELMLSILSSLAESESVSISENSKWSVQKRFQNGTFIIAYPPYGYDNDNGTMVIVPEQAEIVKEIFAACLAGKGTHAIAKDLNARGIKTKKNGKWGAGAINAILTNEKYTGDVIFQKTYSDSSFNRHINYGERDRFLCKNHHEPIISHEDFEKVRAVLDQRAMEKGNGTDTYRYQNRYCFSGKIKCGECATTFKRRQHYKPSGNYVAWTCGKHLETRKNAPCSTFRMRALSWLF